MGRPLRPGAGDDQQGAGSSARTGVSGVSSPLRRASHRRTTSSGCWPMASDRRPGDRRTSSAASARTSAA
eukprot:2623746-Alexandrium_andersonii.AAC.1